MFQYVGQDSVSDEDIKQVIKKDIRELSTNLVSFLKSGKLEDSKKADSKKANDKKSDAQKSEAPKFGRKGAGNYVPGLLAAFTIVKALAEIISYADNVTDALKDQEFATFKMMALEFKKAVTSWSGYAPKLREFASKIFIQVAAPFAKFGRDVGEVVARGLHQVD